jgi:hypothetical protein
MTKTFLLRIDMGNDAMQTGDDVAIALRVLAGMVESPGVIPFSHYRNIYDINGNIVGKFGVKNE